MFPIFNDAANRSLFFQSTFKKFLNSQQKKIARFAVTIFALLGLACSFFCFKLIKAKKQSTPIKKLLVHRLLVENSHFDSARQSQIETSRANLHSIPEAIQAYILNCFLEPASYFNLSLLSKNSLPFLQNRQVIALQLEKLELEDLVAIPLQEKLRLIKLAAPYLTKLDLTESDISKHQFKEIVPSCPLLKTIDLTGCDLLSSEVLPFLPQKLESFTANFNISEKDFIHFPPTLHSLKLHCGNIHLTDNAGYLFKRFNNLQRIDLSSSSFFFMTKLCQHCRSSLNFLKLKTPI